MKKSKNKFIIGIILLVFITLLVQLYISYFANRVDTNSYLSLLEGQGTLNEQLLKLEAREALEAGDKVRIIGSDSLALIEWGDGSITRLAGNTKISIGEANISKDYTKINISFDLISGKSWSNVVSFLGKDSYFKQSFENVEAGVRGTVFNVDLDNQYIHVLNHQVSLKQDNGKEIVISEDEPFSLETFSFLSFTEFIQNFRDAQWQDINTKFDSSFILGLKESLEKDISNSLQQNNPFHIFMKIFSKEYAILNELEKGGNFQKIEKDIASLSAKKKQGTYNKVLSEYQKLNFVNTQDKQMYERKTLYKRALLLLSQDTQEKEILLRSTLLDFEELIKSKNLDNISDTLSIITDNKDLLKDIDIKSIISTEDLIPENLKNLLGDNFEDIKSLLNIDIKASDFVTPNIGELKDKAEEKIADGLDGILNLINN